MKAHPKEPQSHHTAVAGTYTITYTVSDTAGNVATITRTIKVEAVTTPSTPSKPEVPITPTEPSKPSQDNTATNNVTAQ